MTPRQYQRAAMRTIGTFDSVADRMAFCAMEIMSESGEVANLSYKHLWQGHPLDHHKLMLEIGDVMWGTAAMAETIGVTLAMPAKSDWTSHNEFADYGHRMTRVVLRLGKWAGLLDDAVCGYLASGTPNDIAQLDPLVQMIFTQLCSLCDCLGYTPQQVMDANIAKLKKRYPDGFSPKASIARVDTQTTPGTVPTAAPTKFLQILRAGETAPPIEFAPHNANYAVAQLPDGSTVYRFGSMPDEPDKEASSGIPADYADSAE